MALQGVWKFVPRDLVLPGSIHDVGGRAVLPGTWASFFGEGVGTPPRSATFALTVLVDTHVVKEIAIVGTEQSSAYTLWVDGTRVIENGRPAVAAQDEVELVRFRQNSVSISSPRVDLVLQASTFHMDYRGKVFRFRMAGRERMETEVQRGRAPFLLAMGILLIFAVQYLGFLAPMTRERSFIWFGLFCLAWLVFGVCAPCQYTFATILFPGISFRTWTVATFFAVAGAILLVGLFCQEMFPNRFQGAANRIFAAVLSLFVVALPLVPFTWIFQLVGVVVVVGYGEMALLALSLVLALRRRVSGSRTFAIGFALFVASTARDGLILTGFVDSSFGMLLGGAALAVAESFMLSRKFLRTHRENASLLVEVQAQNVELGRLSRIKDDFLTNTSHELRTPLHGILGLTQSVLADSRWTLAPEARRSLELVSGSATRLTRLVNDILDVSKIRNHDLHLRMSAIDLRGLLPIVLAHFPPPPGRAVALDCEVESDLPPVRADEDRLVQILFNLVGNAVKYTDRGVVRLRAVRVGDQVEISVEDTGVGIPPDQIDLVFEPFEQVPGQSRGGTGLGLSITSKLVELHGSKIQVESVPEEGSVFKFRLSVAGPGEVVPERAREEVDRRRIEPWTSIPDAPGVLAVASPVPGPRPVVLAFDDEPVNLEVVRAFLEARGMEVVTAPDGRRALELVEEHRPSVVLLDVTMPFRNGYEVCALIRERHRAIDLPVLFLSARSRLEDVVHGFTAGGDDYILKPFLGQELVARVQAWIRHREAVRVVRENQALKVELADTILERRRLESARDGLLGLFHRMEEPILVVDRDGGLRFVNQAMARLHGVRPEELMERPVQDLFLDPVLPLTGETSGTVRLRRRAENGGSVLRLRPSSFQVDEERLWVLVAEPESPQGLPSGASIQVIRDLERGEERLAQLRSRMDCIAEDMQQDFPIGDLQDVLGRIRGMVSPIDGDTTKLALACEVMNDVLALWTDHTGKGKADFAEESGLWKVQMDANGWRRPATLDKYLDPQRIPRLPKWRTIQKSVEYVLGIASGNRNSAALAAKAARLSSMP